MKPVTWIHTADLHLDEPIKGWKGSKEEAWRRSQEYRQTFERIISLVKKRKVPFLFISGDFMEYGYVSKSTVRFVQEQFRQISGTQVLIAPGNHDPYRPDSVYCLEEWPEHVHIFGGEWESLPFPEFDLTVYGRGFVDFTESEWKAPAGLNENGRKIMIVHGDFLVQEGSSPYFPIREHELAPLEMDYVALGHIHKAADYRLNNRRRTWVCYPGSPEALNWKETGERTVTYGVLDDRGVSIERVPIQTRAYENHRVDIQGCETKEEVIIRILQETAATDKNNYHAVELTGRRPRELELKEDSLRWMEERLKQEGFYAVYLEDQTKPDFDLEYYRGQPGVIGAFIRRMEERMERNPDERADCELALYKGLEALLAKEHMTS